MGCILSQDIVPSPDCFVSEGSYPAGHVYIHEKLYELTSSGLNIPLAQQIYGALYVLSLALTCVIYLKAGGVPNWILLFLPLSKRLHSIYALRMFNDCWAVVGAQAGILTLQRGYFSVACILFRLAMSENPSHNLLTGLHSV